MSGNKREAVRVHGCEIGVQSGLMNRLTNIRAAQCSAPYVLTPVEGKSVHIRAASSIKRENALQSECISAVAQIYMDTQTLNSESDRQTAIYIPVCSAAELECAPLCILTQPCTVCCTRTNATRQYSP